MEDITVLPENKRLFIKSITFTFSGQKLIYRGTIVYARKVSEVYRMHPDPRIDNFNRCLMEYQENEMPNDAMDNKILAAIKECYPKAEMKTSLQMLNTDLKHNRRMFDVKKHIELNVRISANVDSLTLPIVLLADDARLFQYLKDAIYSIRVDDNELVQVLNCDRNSYVNYNNAIN